MFASTSVHLKARSRVLRRAIYTIYFSENPMCVTRLGLVENARSENVLYVHIIYLKALSLSNLYFASI